MFSDKLKNIRKSKRILQKELAQAIGVGNTTVSNWEKGLSTPDYNMLCKIADYFNVTLDFLLDRDVEKEVETAWKYAKEMYNFGEEYKDQLREYTVLDALTEDKYKSFDRALELSDAAFIFLSRDYSDYLLKSFFVDSFDRLNRLGKFEAYKRILELSEVERYRDEDYPYQKDVDNIRSKTELEELLKTKRPHEEE